MRLGQGYRTRGRHEIGMSGNTTEAARTGPARTPRFRLRARPAVREAGPGRRRVPLRRPRYDTDERPDVGRPPPRLEIAPDRHAAPVEDAPPPPSRRGGRHRRHRLPHPRGGRAGTPTSPCSTSTRRCCGRLPSARARSMTAASISSRQCRDAAAARQQLRQLHHRLRHPERASASMRRSGRHGACSSPAGASCAWNSPASTCRCWRRSTTPILPRDPAHRRAGWRATGNPTSTSWNRSASSLPGAFAAMIGAAGFSHVTHRRLSGGIVAIHSAWKIS